MCGFAGVLGEPAEDAASVWRTLERRGVPDGSWTCGRFRGWQSRLAIVAPEEGRLPVSWTLSPDHHIVLFGAGQIHNHLALRRLLSAADRARAPSSDLALVGLLWARFGLQGLRLLRGPYSAAIWEQREGRRRLWLCRDRLGRRPLFVARSPGRLAFATSIATLKCLHPVGAPCPDRVLQFLGAGTTCADGAVHRDIESVPPGGVWGFDLDGGCVMQARLPPPALTGLPLGAVLAAAMERIRLADTPPVLALSGGVDSSWMALRLARHGPVNAITLVRPGVSDPASSRSAQVARTLGLRSAVVSWEPPPAARALACLSERVDRPASTPAVLHNDALHAAVPGRLLLGGHGADEVLGGYGRYVAFATGQPPAWSRAELALRVCPEFVRGRRALADWIAASSSSERLARWWDLTLLQAWDNFHLPDENGLHHGVEVRSPFLDLDVVRSGLSEPTSHKEVLRAELRSVLPSELVDAPKSGFDTPFDYAAWLISEWPDLRRAWLGSEAETLVPRHLRALLQDAEAPRLAPLLAWRAVALSAHLQSHRRPQILGQ